MSFLKKQIQRLKDLNYSSPSPSNKEKRVNPSISNGAQINETHTNGSATGSDGTVTSDSRRRSREVIAAERARRSMDRERAKAESRRRESMARLEAERFLKEGPPELTKLYKPLSMNMSKSWNHENRVLFKELEFAKMEGKTITFRARVHALRRMSAKLVFIVFRQQTITIQGVLHSFGSCGEPRGKDEPHGTISDQMVRMVEHYPIETIVVVQSKLRKAQTRVKNATIHDYEFEVYEVHKLASLTEHVPFSVYDAENINRETEDPDDDADNTSSRASGTPLASQETSRVSQEISHVSQELSRIIQDKRASRGSFDIHKQQRSLPQRVRLNNRIVDLRTGPAQAIFRIQAGICNMFRSYLDERGFLEIHTPKLQGGATESGATVFELNYFGRPAFLAQSPQLAKQMCISADFERVYEIGAVFRAEDSNTPRHLTEYTGLDIEMALEEHYHEALTIIDGMFKNLWKGIYERYQPEIDIISRYYPQEKVVWLEETPRLTFSDGVQMLKDDGYTDEDGTSPVETEDLSTRAEIRLGQLVKKKFKTDYYILDKFPTSVRPFYTMLDPSDDRFTNSFDIFMRGQEILTGGQRIHDAKFLETRMKKKGVRPETMMEYLEGFRWGAPPHAGCGIGLERLTYLFLNLGNIRLASLFARDPKSLPAKSPTLSLRYEEASTTNPPWYSKDIDPDSELAKQKQPLEKLIANYGDAANTSWLDKRYHVWRHRSTGAAQGYIIYHGFVISVGDPLCAKSQYPQVISAYVNFLKEEHSESKPIWMIAGKDVEEYLGEKFNWRTLAPIAEERADPRNNPALKDVDLARKIRHAEKEGMKTTNVPFSEPVSEDLKSRIDQRVRDWQKRRKGSQVHLTEIRPWLDEQHRRYFYTESNDGVIQAFLVLHQLSPQNGYQVKFSLEFPGAPSGTIESLILHSLKAIVSFDPDVKQVTFGTGAMPQLQGGRNLGKHTVKALKATYDTINKQFKLTNKSEFREKMGVWNEPSYVCYPRGGLGTAGIWAIMGFLGEDG